MMRQLVNYIQKTVIPATLNSYSIVFFFNNWILAVALLIVTFLNFFAGLSGFLAVLTSVLIASGMGFDKNQLKQGIFSFNALLTGIGIGTFFEPGLVFFILLFLAALFSLILSVVLGGWFGKYGLPFLSLPFVFSIWIILLSSAQLTNFGLTQRNVFWINEVYSVGGKPLLDFFQTIDNLPLNKMIIVYLKSMSSILFQDNLLAGILIAASLLVCSRITFLLSFAGFLSAFLFAQFVGTDMASLSFYNIGANYTLLSIAIGGYFTIPSRRSFLWAILLIPLTSMIILFMLKLLSPFQLPMFSLPFSLVTILFVYFLILRERPGKLILTQVQHFSPELNLYTYCNSVDRLTGSKYLPLHLPFWGEWTISQGYNGKYTHLGDWSKAFDFVLYDHELKTFEGSSKLCENYYCYNKPVLAPADGMVIDIIDSIDDNIPGRVNTKQNWGNLIVIKHLDNLYTQMSHLRPGSFRVNKGEFVKQGQIVASCGNSGRSPEPHLHFQVQSVPLSGAKTIEYPVSYYLVKINNGYQLQSFKVPGEGDIVSNISTNTLLKAAFDFQPGMVLKFNYKVENSVEKSEKWEAFTDAYNYKYFYCADTQSTAWFVNDGTMFYFTSFYGDHQSLLYYFYLTAYKVLLGYYPYIEITDLFPLQIIRNNKFSMYVHDFVAPFYQYLKAVYKNKPSWSDSSVDPAQIKLSSSVLVSSFKTIKEESTGTIFLAGNRIKEFSFNTSKIKLWAQNSDIP